MIVSSKIYFLFLLVLFSAAILAAKQTSAAFYFFILTFVVLILALFVHCFLKCRESKQKREMLELMENVNNIQLNLILSNFLSNNNGDIDEENQCCSICLEELIHKKNKKNENKVIFKINHCDHCFHKECISDWIKTNINNPTCPVCRTNIVPLETSPASPQQVLTVSPPPPLIMQRSERIIARRSPPLQSSSLYVVNPSQISIRQNEQEEQHEYEYEEERIVIVENNQPYLSSYPPPCYYWSTALNGTTSLGGVG